MMSQISLKGKQEMSLESVTLRGTSGMKRIKTGRDEERKGNWKKGQPGNRRRDRGRCSARRRLCWRRARTGRPSCRPAGCRCPSASWRRTTARKSATPTWRGCCSPPPAWSALPQHKSIPSTWFSTSFYLAVPNCAGALSDIVLQTLSHSGFLCCRSKNTIPR